MENDDKIVKEHYAVSDLTQRILEGLALNGADIDNLTIDDIAAVDEFHIGGRKATKYALSKMALSGNEHILDVGCGIGGAARTFADQSQGRVTGIDLTPEYVEVAQTLSRLTRLEGQTEFHVANALSLPFDDQTFDAAYSFHVAMNIKEREALYGEIARVMKPDAVLCIYDVMKKADAPLTFPVPWAQTANVSHLVTAEEMRPLLEGAGFEIDDVEDRTEFALEFFNQSILAAAKGPQPLGIHLIMGPTAREKIQNVKRAMEDGILAPFIIIARLKKHI